MAMGRIGAAAPDDDNVFTVMLIISTVFVFAATLAVLVQFQSFYGLGNLF